MEPRPFSRGGSLLNANSVDILFDAEHLTRSLIGTEQLGRLTRSPALSRRRSAFRTASAPYSTDAPPDPSHPDSVAHDCPSSATLSHHGQTTVTSRDSGFSCLPNVLSVSEPRPCTGPVSIIRTLSSLRFMIPDPSPSSFRADIYAGLRHPDGTLSRRPGGLLSARP